MQAFLRGLPPHRPVRLQLLELLHPQRLQQLPALGAEVSHLRIERLEHPFVPKRSLLMTLQVERPLSLFEKLPLSPPELLAERCGLCALGGAPTLLGGGARERARQLRLSERKLATEETQVTLEPASRSRTKRRLGHLSRHLSLLLCVDHLRSDACGCGSNGCVWESWVCVGAMGVCGSNGCVGVMGVWGVMGYVCATWENWGCDIYM